MSIFKNSFDSQVKRVLGYLQSGKSITSYDAFKKFRCTRLSAVIYVLKKRGYHIESVLEFSDVKNGTRSHYSRYWLVND